MARDISDALDLDKIEALAAQGLSVKQIADCLGIGRSTLYDHKKAKPDVSDAIKRGRSKGLSVVTNALFQSAKGGNVTAQIFYLKNREPEKWKDRRDTTLAGDPKKPLKVMPFEFVDTETAEED